MLDRIVKMAELLVAQQSHVDELEAELKVAKKELTTLEREDLPTLMTEAGLQEITLNDGTTIQIKEDVDTKIPTAHRDAALNWLIQNGYGGLIKTNVAVVFGRGDHDQAVAVRDRLAAEYEGVELKEDVHHSTLKAFVKERLTAGEQIPFDLFGIYPYNKAIIRR